MASRKFADVDSLPVQDSIKTSLKGMGISRLTRVQSDTFAHIASGKSCIAVAKTGEGKTLSYLVPVITRLINERSLNSGNRTSCLILVPSRELCHRVGGVLVALHPNVNVLLAYGKPSASFNTLLKHGPQVIVGTTGRIASLVKKGDIDIKAVKTIVLDHLDSIEEYRKEVSPVLTQVVNGTQIIGFGTTMSSDLKRLLSEISCLRGIDVIDTVGMANKTPKRLSHVSVKAPDSAPLRISGLASLLVTRDYQQAMVFCESPAQAKAIARHPLLAGKAKALHGSLKQSERDRILNSFGAKAVTILVCTDLASRGLDVPGVDLVVNFRPPTSWETYAHRAGRAGRAGARGESVLLYSHGEHDRVLKIARDGKLDFTHAASPSRAQQKQIAIDKMVSEASLASEAIGPDSPLRKFVDSVNYNDKSILAARCLAGLLGTAGELLLPSCSILSAEKGYLPVLFVDPESRVLSSRGDLLKVIHQLGIRIGTVASSESGYVVDVATEDAVRICFDRPDETRALAGVEVLALDKLPKLSDTEGLKRRRNASSLPWRRKNGTKLK